MATGSSTVIQDIQTLFHVGTTGAASDAELLERFLARRGSEAENAFAAVVARHGPMVLRVCGRILSEPNDAEDAFQVTFLVLARKAKGIARRESLANWLYGVAVRSARELRASTARRREREAQMKERLRANDTVHVPDDEVMSALDEELSRLPASFRAAVVLCDLEDKTHTEAARILGVPVGTVSSRLVRGRSLLRSRLTRRGLNPSAADPPRDKTAMIVPAPLIAATARAAAQFAAGGNLAGIVPAYLATLTHGMLKTMMLAKLTSNGMVISAIVSLSLGAVAVAAGGTAYLRREAGPETSRISAATDEDWAWVDELRNANEATKERLKRCGGSATSNFASLHRLIFDYDLKNEIPQLPLDASGKLTSVERGFSHGTVYWKDGIVRYDHHPVGKLAPDGRKLFFKKPWVQSVVRSRDMFAYTGQDTTWGLLLSVKNPPRSVAEWEQGGEAQLRYLDPLLHYAEPFCQDGAQLRQIVESCRAVESEETDGKVLLRFLRDDNNFRMEIICDKAADWLPTSLRSGQVRDGKWLVFVELKRDWQKLSAVWYPTHQGKTSYFGVDMKPVKEVDLSIRNLRVNGAVNLPDSVFSLGGMDIPDGTPGFDNRQEPVRSLIRAGGVVREPRPGEGRSPRNVDQEKAARQEVEETVPEEEYRRTAPQPAATEPRGTVRKSVRQQEYVSLLRDYETARRPLEKAHIEGKTDESRREAYLSLGRLEWSFASRFLELALKYPNDPGAVDALGGLVANTFTPPEANQAADILIRDHLASDKMIPIFYQLVQTLIPAPRSAAERLLRAAAEKAPTSAARGLACLKLAQLLKYRADAVRKMRGPDPDPFMKLEQVARSGGKDPAPAPLEDPDALSKEAEQFYDRVMERYADIEGKHHKLGDVAAKALFQLRELAVGRPAPEIEGPDIDGKQCRLSDYRGRIVVLSFDGKWCGPAIYPHGRALLEQNKGKPFALLSVNIDEQEETLRKSVDSGEITWRCWWEGGSVQPNCERWRQEWFPMVYVLDANGIIRAKGEFGKAIDQVVEQLIKELPSHATAPVSQSSNR